jgi:hypothetical protein
MGPFTMSWGNFYLVIWHIYHVQGDLHNFLKDIYLHLQGTGNACATAKSSIKGDVVDGEQVTRGSRLWYDRLAFVDCTLEKILF